MTITTPRRFGWRPNPPDTRDRLHARRHGMVRAEGRRFDGLIDHVRDQGNTSSCVGHACVGALELLYALEQRPISPRSPMHAYWSARARDKFQHEDAGAYIRSCLKVLRKRGVCSEATLPLDDRDPQRGGTINARPPQAADNEAVTFADFSFEAVQGGAEGTIDTLQNGKPVVIGGDVTTAFVFCSSDETIPAPKPGDVRQGGHAWVLVGFDRHGERVLGWNSWGSTYGFGGLMWLDAEWCEDSNSSDKTALVATATAEVA
jgi:C1A family cysteine protease